MPAIAKGDALRIISFTLAGADVFQTIPGTFRLYKKQWKQRSISPVAFFYASVRYLTIISLISNGIGALSTKYTLETCRPWYMLPNVTAMLAGMAVQGIIFIRTWAISGRSVWVLRVLGLILLLDIPVQIFGIVYHRDPTSENGNCKGKVIREGEPDWNIVYYIAHVIFDLIACFTSTFWLVYASRSHQAFNLSKFVKKVIRHGLLFTIAVCFANLWVVLEFSKVLTTGVGAALPLAIVLISAQHLVLSTQRPESDHPSSSEATGRDRSRSLGHSGGPNNGRPFPSFAHRNSTHGDVELQSGVFVLTETYVQPRDEMKSKTFDQETSSDIDNSTRKGAPAVF